jgi:tryptophan synthase beta chain
MNTPVDFSTFPDARGHFGIHGGRFVSETLMAALTDLEAMYMRLKDDPAFLAEFDRDLAHYVGRPSPLYHAERWSRELGGAQIYLKREDLNHTGAHKVNNTIGQALLAKHSGKTRVIAETGAGQHGVATATIAARSGNGVRGVHGRRRRQASGHECLSHEAVGGHGGAGHLWLQDAQGRHE